MKCKISVSGKISEQVNEVVYLGVLSKWKMERSMAAGNRGDGILAALMKRRNVNTFGRTQCSVGSWYRRCIRQRNVGITEEE